MTETINKYMEEMAKRHAEQDEWLKKFYQNTQTSRENHEKIIQSLESKVKTLTNEVEGRTYKENLRNARPSLWKMVHLCFSDDEKQETKREEANEAITTVNINITPDIIPTREKEKQNEEPWGVKKTNEEPKMRHWCEAISQEKEGVRHYWASCNPYYDECDGKGLPDNMEKHYWKSNNNREHVDLEWEELSFDNWVRIKFEREEKEGEDVDDSIKCGEDKSNTILEIVHDKLDDDWFIGTNEDDDDLKGIIDYPEPKSYDGFINLDGKAYKERMQKHPPILIEKAEVTSHKSITTGRNGHRRAPKEKRRMGVLSAMRWNLKPP
ncbi:hypothetical protein Tco_0701668 [Tanacetum coccineum]